MATSRTYRSRAVVTSLPVALVLFALVSACDHPLPDAFGNFEATEVAVSAEFAGPLLRMDAVEGQRLEAGAVVAELDTLQLSLQRAELDAQRESARLRAAEARAQVRVLEAQLETARDDLARTERLYASEAATAQELSRFGGSVRVIEQQVAASQARVRVANQEAASVDTRIVQIVDRLGRGRIRNPVTGTVLTTFAEAGEFVQPGQPLYTIARLDTLTLRAYVSGDQLAQVSLGSMVQVRADLDVSQVQSLPGRVTWIASEAEFTPTPIQTREERVDQVYAVKVRVANPDGLLKVGMPGELILGTGSEAQR
jgi:HlyD family secretion protein